MAAHRHHHRRQPRPWASGSCEAFLDDGDRVATCSRTATTETERWAGDAEHSPIASCTCRSTSPTATRVHRVRPGRWSSASAPIDVLVNNAGVAREGVLGLFS